MTEESPEPILCILCTERPADTDEHVIPDSIGGRLVEPILCKKCNNDMGTKLAANLKEVQFIKDALRILKPRIATSITKGQEALPLIGRAEDGSIVRAIYIEGIGVRIRQGPGAYDSRILDSKDAQREIKKRMLEQRPDFDPDILAQLLALYAEDQEEAVIELPDGVKFVKRAGLKLQPDISIAQVNPYLVVLIAYEYMALYIGPEIYDDRFQFIRTSIINQQPSDRIKIVEGMNGREPEPVHILLIEQTDAGIKVTIFFFRYLVFEVEFLDLSESVPKVAFVQDLETKEKGFRVYKGNTLIDYVPFRRPGPDETTY